MEMRVEQYRADALSQIDQRACLARGGAIRGVGMFAMPACVIPFADAGKSCSDMSECLGKCIVYNGDLPEGAPSTGTCQHDDHLDGCWAEIVDGRIGRGWCVE